MNRRFKKCYSNSFQAKVIGSLKENSNLRKETEAYVLPVSNDEARVAEIFADTLGVDASTLVETLMAAELARMLRLKRKGATFSEMNGFYNEVIEIQAAQKSEIDKLVANYLPIDLDELQNSNLVKYAKKNLGLRVNNYRPYRLANFDGKPVIEMIFYIDQSRERKYSQAWLGIKGAPIKSLTFSKVSYLNEFVHQVSIFANLFDLEFCHVGSRGLRYER
ncbi:hypothetical protein [Teredinibacter purpureus]|uniref:hypothetical protein n=1 Tax=Teredinibacter purpureus TaxID=2731756 RepID=UPI0005F8002E|nr:hypothetical protein [Teredinibacter purpureus]